MGSVDGKEEISKIERKSSQKHPRGKLTVFLGAAPGVGKTFTMLKTAVERVDEGVDTVIGVVETYHRPEMNEFVKRLPFVPAKHIESRGKLLSELDVGAIIARKPQLVLVDDLAHTNAQGCRHHRRYQDIDELLDVGISVYTSVNIQHIESLNDVVARIIGVVEMETIPDHIFDEADTIQLIDISAEDLIKRFKEGKIGAPSYDQEVLKKFFRAGNVNALRELALRYTASRVDKDLDEYMKEHQIAGPWPAAGRIMVCISESPFSAQLIRAARRLAVGLRTEWLAVHVETTRRRYPIGDKERARVIRNIKMAEELGAKALMVVGEDLTSEILEIARSHNVTEIVIGKPRHGKLYEFLFGSLVDGLIRRSGGISVYTIQAPVEDEPVENVRTAPAMLNRSWLPYVKGSLMAVLVSTLGFVIKDNVELINIAILYQLPIILCAFWWGRWPSYFVALFSALVFDYFFVPPFFTLSIENNRYLLSFITFLAVAFVIGGRTEKLRSEAISAGHREKGIRAVYEFSREIAAVIDMSKIGEQLTTQVAETINHSIVLLLPDATGRLIVHSFTTGAEGHDVPKQQVADNVTGQPLLSLFEAEAAAWSFEHSQAAGHSTDTLSEALYLYLPLKTRENVVGILGIDVSEKLLTPEQRRLADAWAGLAAIAIERVQLAEEARQAALLVESDRLRTALFNSISHELRTPLSTIIGSVTTLLDAGQLYSAQERHDLLESIKYGATRMDRVVVNLLDTARIESGMMQLKVDWCDIEDITGAALHRLGDTIKEIPITIRFDPKIPLIRGDCVLLEQVIINLVDNAIKYSPLNSGIEIAANVLNGKVIVSVGDEGVGIPEEDLTRVFDKFYRVQQPEKTISGTGLGLSICKGIIEAHGGEIWAQRRARRGTKVKFSIPIAEQPVVMRESR